MYKIIVNKFNATIKYGLIFAMAINVFLLPQTLLAADSANVIDQTTPTVPKDLTVNDVDHFVAPLSEKQVRGLLINQLNKKAEENEQEENSQSNSILKLLKGINNPYTPLGRGVAATISASKSYVEEFNNVANKLSQGNGAKGFFKMIGLLIILIGIAWLIEIACLHRWRESLSNKTNVSDNLSLKSKIGYPFIRFAINFIGLVIFTLVGYIVMSFILDQQSVRYVIVMRFFDAFVFFRFCTFIFRLILHPHPNGLSLVENTININVLFICMCLFSFFHIIGTEYLRVFSEYGFSNAHFVFTTIILFGLIVNPIVIWFVWTQRYDIDAILFGEVQDSQCQEYRYAYKARSMIWPSIVTFIIYIAFINWQIQALIGNKKGQETIEITWWVTLLFPLVDLIITSLLNKLVSHELFAHERFQARKHRFIFIIRSVTRLISIAIITITMMEAWGFGIVEKFSSESGRNIIRSLADIGVTIVLGYIIWEAIQLWMERNLPEEPEEGLLELDGEGGGAAASRTETLLPLFRTILLILLCVVVTMSILYSLGVQIGPLLAGAGVVGIAIGFGSQKLVQDIISGMFFLIDDAFRKGEYVELAGLRGTVEKLSVRSMRLRHHLGAVQTVPYGEITTVKNLSRDWVTMKLELRLPYDVDIEKVRKIIKKIGQEMLKDEEVGPHILQPLKSQGVMRVEESALIIRMKFTTVPGEQWIIRRHAYTRVRDALQAEGIEFAHREVTVRVPGSKNESNNEQERLPTPPKDNHAEQQGDDTVNIGGAAMTSVIASDIKKHSKIDDDKDSGDEQ